MFDFWITLHRVLGMFLAQRIQNPGAPTNRQPRRAPPDLRSVDEKGRRTILSSAGPALQSAEVLKPIACSLQPSLAYLVASPARRPTPPLPLVRTRSRRSRWRTVDPPSRHEAPSRQIRSSSLRPLLKPLAAAPLVRGFVRGTTTPPQLSSGRRAPTPPASAGTPPTSGLRGQVATRRTLCGPLRG